MEIKTLNDLYIVMLKDMHSGEKQLIKALPKMAEAATTPELKSSLESHLAETHQQFERLEKIFGMMDVDAGYETCEAMKGLVKEGSEIIEHTKTEEVLDAGLIAAAQKVEHYEIGSYGTLVALAKILGHTQHIQLLEQTLREEKAADAALNKIAEGHVNRLATSTQLTKVA